MAGTFLENFSQAFTRASESRRNREAIREESELDRQLKREGFEMQRGLQQQQIDLQKRAQEFELKKYDAELSGKFLTVMGASGEHPAARAFVMDRLARDMGIDTKSESYRGLQKLLITLPTEQRQAMIDGFTALNPELPPGQVSAIVGGLLAGKVDPLEIGKMLTGASQQRARTAGPQFGDQPGGAMPPSAAQPGSPNLRTLFAPESLATTPPALGGQVGGTQQPPSGVETPAQLNKRAFGLLREADAAARRGDNEFADNLRSQAEGLRQMAKDVQSGKVERERLEFEKSVDPAETELRKELGKKTGELWASFQEAGAVASSRKSDMDLLEELAQVAPQGPLNSALNTRIVGRFPGIGSFTTAGAAFNAVVSRLAPQMRVEGSGSTSDIEFQAMLDSLPSLSNFPEANAVIIAMLKAKAAVDIERSEVVDAFGSGEISQKEARKRLTAINRRSILTPEMKGVIEKAIGAGGGFSEEQDERFRTVFPGIRRRKLEEGEEDAPFIQFGFPKK